MWNRYRRIGKRLPNRSTGISHVSVDASQRFSNTASKATSAGRTASVDATRRTMARTLRPRSERYNVRILCGGSDGVRSVRIGVRARRCGACGHRSADCACDPCPSKRTVAMGPAWGEALKHPWIRCGDYPGRLLVEHTGMSRTGWTRYERVSHYPHPYRSLLCQPCPPPHRLRMPPVLRARRGSSRRG